MSNSITWGEFKELMEDQPEVTDETPLFFVMIEASDARDINITLEPTGLVVT